jgi:hypothetical protein
MDSTPGQSANAAGFGKRPSVAVDALAILSLCTVLMWLRWTKMDSLLNSDPPLWLHQVSRVARGEWPYLDFSWNYPPLAALLFGWTLRWFGVSFAAAQATLDAISLAVVFAAYLLLGFFLPRLLRLAVIFLLTAVSATVLTKLSLFSMLTYSPSLQIGVLGLFLLLIGALSYLRSGLLGWRNGVLVAAGAFIAAFSRLETWLAVCAAIAVLGLADRALWFRGKPRARWVRHYLLLLAACNLPAMAAYAWTAWVVGSANLRAGMEGYGLATFACPWWPTGLGVFGALAALGQAAFLAAVCSLPWRRQFTALLGKRYRSLWLCAWAGLALYLGYQWYLNRQVLLSALPAARKLAQVMPSVAWTSSVLLPAMWAAIVYWCFLAFRMARPSGASRLRAEQAGVFLLLTVAVSMAVRGLFGTTLFPYTEVSAICYPMFLLLGPLLLWRFLESPAASGIARSGPSPAVLVAALAIGYGLLRLIAGYPLLLSDQPYRTLSTCAGSVRLPAHRRDAEVYRYVMENTTPEDTVLEIPYGGGINFASGRRSPTFVTQFVGLPMPERFQRLDLERFLEHKPRVVIAENSPRFGTLHGVPGDMACACPRLVWMPDRPSSDPGKIYPVVGYIQRNYRVDKIIGDRLLLVPNETAPNGRF